jgi:hypothetical protein
MRRLRCSFWAIASLIGVGVLAADPAWAQFGDMVKHIPGKANAIFLVNAQKVFASEVAKSQDWQAQRGKRFDSGLTCIPPRATRVVVGTQIDLEFMRPLWETAVVEFPTAPLLADVEEHYGGINDTIANTAMVRMADDTYVVRFSDKLLGAFGPSNRQLASSWIQQTENQLSPYLQEALSYVDAGTEVILAIDTTDAVAPALVEQRLQETDNAAIKNAKSSPAEIAQIVSSIRGVMLGITFGKEAYGKIKIDFGQDATPLADIAKPLLLEVLAKHGAMIDEVTQWKVQTKGTTVYLDGSLGESGLMRITSLINLPTQALQAPATSGGKTPVPPAGGAGQTVSPSDPQQLVIETTQNYYKSIEHVMADLRGRKGEARTIGQIGLWFGSYANRVERLPLLNVDTDMLQYGEYVSQQLRNASMSIKGYGINKRVAEVNANNNAAPFGGAVGQAAGMGGPSYASQYGGWAYGAYGRAMGSTAAYGWASRQGAAGTAYWAGRSEMRQAMAARTQADVQLKSVAATQVQQIMEQLREAHEQIRRMMTEKYKVEF